MGIRVLPQVLKLRPTGHTVRVSFVSSLRKFLRWVSRMAGGCANMGHRLSVARHTSHVLVPLDERGCSSAKSHVSVWRSSLTSACRKVQSPSSKPSLMGLKPRTWPRRPAGLAGPQPPLYLTPSRTALLSRAEPLISIRPQSVLAC